MKKIAALILMLLAMIPVCALGEGPVLLMEMPEDVQMVENVSFDDGDFIQTYQMAGGTSVHLLRYAAFEMTIEDLIASEWAGAQAVAAMKLDSVGGFAAKGATLTSEEGDKVSIIVVDYGEGKLVFEAVVPQNDEQGAAAVQTMIDTMDVLMDGAGEAKGMEEEVG